MWEKRLTVCGANHIYVHYLSEMQTLFDTCNVHAQGILYIIIAPKELNYKNTMNYSVLCSGGYRGGGQTRPMPPLTNRDTPPVHRNEFNYMSSASHSCRR